jgi:iron complex transport system substrate-binding protein
VARHAESGKPLLREKRNPRQAVRVGDRLVGVSNECDFPAAAKTQPVVVKPALPLEKMSLCEIDTVVTERIGSGQNL